MTRFLYSLLESASYETVEYVLCFLRVGIGFMMMFHGLPKIMGGSEGWAKLGTFMIPLGIHFLPLMWGFLGAITESLGSLLFALGLGTRIVSAALAFMMFVATVWHLDRGDSYQVYSFPISLIVIFISYLIMGGGSFSLDNYIVRKI